MRDTRKDKAYFEAFLEYQYSRIESKITRLEYANEEKKQRILVSLIGFELDLLKAEFSAGAPKEKLRSLLIRANSIVSEYRNIVYEDLLNLLSLSVMLNLNKRNEINNLIENNKVIIEKDRLLKFIASYLKGEVPKWDNKITLKKEFSELDKVFSEDDKESMMLKYLDTWYEKHSKYGWYNSHQGNLDTYCGYWSFESAAIANILSINESELQISKYYPIF